MNNRYRTWTPGDFNSIIGNTVVFLIALFIAFSHMACSDMLDRYKYDPGDYPRNLSGTFYVNNNAPYAYESASMLHMNIYNAAEMRFNNFTDDENDARWSAWEPYNSTRTWDLEYGNGSITVYAQFRDSDLAINTLEDSITFIERLTPSAPFRQDSMSFSTAVAISGDGSVIVTGAPYEDNGSYPNQGAVYVYIFTGSAWNEIKITSGGPADSYFGYSLSLSDDGTTLAVGAYGENTQTGAVYIFERNYSTPDNWGLRERISITGGSTYDHFGFAVSVSGNGALLAVGAYAVNSERGRVYIFGRDFGGANHWDLMTSVDGSFGGPMDTLQFGKSVSLSSTGSRLAVGAPYQENMGVVYVFDRSGDLYNETTCITSPAIEANVYFGKVTSLSRDGGIVVIAAPFEDNGPNSNQGAVYVYDYSGTQVQRLAANDGSPNDYFGSGTTISGDNSDIFIGVAQDDIGTASNMGSVYRFSYNGSAYIQSGIITAPDGVHGDLFGTSLSLSSDGHVLAAGAQEDTIDSFSQMGSLYIFHY